MFGSIVVPTYPKYGEQEAPSPMIFIVTDKLGKIEAIRRPRPDLGRWEFDELDSNSFKHGEGCNAGEDVAIVIVADKSLAKDRFLALLKTVREMTGRSKIWIQAWGVHPYPLQIPIETEDEKMEAAIKEGDCLQAIVNLLSHTPPPPKPPSPADTTERRTAPED